MDKNLHPSDEMNAMKAKKMTLYVYECTATGHSAGLYASAPQITVASVRAIGKNLEAYFSNIVDFDQRDIFARLIKTMSEFPRCTPEKMLGIHFSTEQVNGFRKSIVEMAPNYIYFWDGWETMPPASISYGDEWETWVDDLGYSRETWDISASRLLEHLTLRLIQSL